MVSKDRPEKLARLALSLCDLMQRINTSHGYPLALRVGMHCGPTIAGVVRQKRRLYDVWGDAVNLASRIESGGEPGRVHVSEAIFHALRHAFDFETRGLINIKGKGVLPTYLQLGARRVTGSTRSASAPCAA